MSASNSFRNQRWPRYLLLAVIVIIAVILGVVFGLSPNTQLSPDYISSGGFGRIFSTDLPKLLNNTAIPPAVQATPLLYTIPSTGQQVVVVADTINSVFVIDASTGSMLSSINLGIPADIATDYLQANLLPNPCSDQAGIKGTPVIDPTTSTVYLWAKTYKDQKNATGIYNELYQFHALSLPDLVERPNFPMDVEGIRARNSPEELGIYFQSGTVQQRPALMQIAGSNVVYAGFGSHCDSTANYTGWVVGIDTATASIHTAYTTLIAPSDWQPPPYSPIVNYGPGAGIWMSGAGFAAYQNTTFLFTTGNGDPKYTRLAADPTVFAVGEGLSNSAVRFAVSDHVAVDFFAPEDHALMDSKDLDMSSGGLTILPAEYFTSEANHTLCVAGGKDVELWILDCEDLSGYSSTANNVLQEIAVPAVFNEATNATGSTFTQVGVYPGEGGFLYHNICEKPLRIYSFNNVTKTFTIAADAAEDSMYGGSSPVITSVNGTAGTGIVWVLNQVGGIRAYAAVPTASGSVKLLWNDTQVYFNSWIQPAIGINHIYVVSTDNKLVAYG
ncbi:hypothetical protein HDU84_007061 [Entophlyctis sp. JEL0112]|nr:hypothetical protein HDU84_007061 [Entophlyctis sp. JEL0112]